MIVEDLIEKEFHSLKSTMSFKEASLVFNECKQSDLPVIDDSGYQGLVLWEQIKGREDNPDPLSTISEQFRKVSVLPSERIIVAINKMTNEGIQALPVVDEENAVLGVLLAINLWGQFAVKSSLVQPGGWIVLSMHKRDFKLSEIAHIVESNNAVMLMHFINFIEGLDLIEVHIKVDRENVNELVQNFQRYDYKVSDVIQAKKFEDDWENRFDELMRFFST